MAKRNREMIVKQRLNDIRKLLPLSLTTDQIAERVGVSRRQVQYDIKKLQEEIKEFISEDTVENILLEVNAKTHLMEQKLIQKISDPKSSSTVVISAINTWMNIINDRNNLLMKLGILQEAPKGFYTLTPQQEEFRKNVLMIGKKWKPGK